MYRHVLSLDQPTPMGRNLLPIEESVPKDKETAWEARRLCLNIFGGPQEYRRNTSISGYTR